MAGFDITREGPRQWRVRRRDGLVEGVFTDRRAALGFARCESLRFSLPAVPKGKFAASIYD
jgi:hypothetical protein